MRAFLRTWLCIPICLLVSNSSSALPLGFGRNQGDLVYQEMMSPNFSVYFDQRTPDEAKLVLGALESAKPQLEHWLAVKRSDPLKVIMSASTSNPSFANFLTDAIELQTLGRGGRDLAWHEYVHSSMYRHLDNIFGPAGSIVHLPWMPAWWIEGLAESLSISAGSDIQFGIERYFALHGHWPSYDKLHSLYDGSRFSSIGYALSGSFVSYIIRSYGAEQLAPALRNFSKYSMPWWWPATFIPFQDFMPMDETLKLWTGKIGSQLWEEYKAAATSYWQSRSDLYLINLAKADPKQTAMGSGQEPSEAHGGLPEQTMNFSSSHSIQARDNRIYFLNRTGKKLYESELIWNGKVGSDFKNVRRLPEEALNARQVQGENLYFVSGRQNDNIEPEHTLWLMKKKRRSALLKRPTQIYSMFLSRNKLIWFEEYLELNQLCWIPLSQAEQGKKIADEDIHCVRSARFPESLVILGQRSVKSTNGDELTEEIWLRQSFETIKGDQHKILIWQANEDKFVSVTHDLGGKPLAVGFNRDETWLSLAGRTQHFLRKIDRSGQCLQEQDLAHIINSLHNAEDHQLVMSLWREGGLLLVKTEPGRGPLQPCRLRDEPGSPLLRAMLDGPMPLTAAMLSENPWQLREEAMIRADQKKAAHSGSIAGVEPFQSSAAPAKEVSWKARPAFAFPWIGYDAMGPSFGILSLPIMENMQNETATLIALYGAESRFPDLQLGLFTSRFKTTYGIDIYRRQTYNRSFDLNTFYFDERGAEVWASRYLQSLDLSVRASYKNSMMRPYLGDTVFWDRFLAKGYLREFNLGVRKSTSLDWAYLSYSLDSSLATKQFNGNYDYEKTGGNVNLSIPLSLFDHESTQSWGMSYSRVRGTRRKFLQEVYSPLRTFIPGNGGGLNELNSQLYGAPYLRNLQFADTQGRLQFSWTTPVVRDLAKLIHIVYLQRLDATAFFNYGRAWSQQIQPRLDSGTSAHGYKLDLQADIKGVKLNLGIGTGQVFQKNWEVFGLIGFDALTDQYTR